ncbi:hypothetical protein VE03_09018 [Pseudogymnoascus sp. 23342-1-I1]|nr:hypothetical protein VE03_09018 [Pseudogymnoascus sp. 23342-1-I1]
MPMVPRLFCSSGRNFFQDNCLSAAWKRRTQAARRRRCVVHGTPAPAQSQPNTSPASSSAPTEHDTAPAPYTSQTNVDASPPTDHPDPASEADPDILEDAYTLDDPDPLDDHVKSAIEMEYSNIATPNKLPTTPPTPSADTDPAVSKETNKTIVEKPIPPAPAPTPGPICAICHEPTGIPRADSGRAAKTEKIAILPCGHTFGHVCLLQWIDQEFGQSCPLCRDRPTHPECGHFVMPALADGAPTLVKKGGKLSPKCESCSFPCDEGKKLVRYKWRMEEARGMALVSMSMVPREWTEGMVQREWLMMDARARAVTTPWDEELEKAWLNSQRGRSVW